MKEAEGVAVDNEVLDEGGDEVVVDGVEVGRIPPLQHQSYGYGRP